MLARRLLPGLGRISWSGVAVSLAMLSAPAMPAETGASGAGGSAAGKPVAGELHFSIYREASDNIYKVTYAYDGVGVLSFGEPTPLLRVPNAYGMVLTPDGDLLVAGKTTDAVYKVNLKTKAYQTQTNTWDDPTRIALEPGLDAGWIADKNGSLFRVPMKPYGTGVQKVSTGSDKAIHALAFRDANTAYYTVDNTNFFDSTYIGILDIRTMETEQWLKVVGDVYTLAPDPYTGSLILCGDKFISQVDTAEKRVISTRAFPEVYQFYSCVVDGEGHALLANHLGDIYLLDYAKSGLVGDSANFVGKQFVRKDIRYVASLIGPGAIKSKPVPMTGFTAVYQDADGNGRIDQAILEYPRMSVIPPTQVSLKDPFTPGAQVLVEADKVSRAEPTRYLLAFAEKEMAYGTDFPAGPLGSILQDTAHFSRAPFEIRDGVGPQLLAAEAVPPQRRGDLPILNLTFSEPLKVNGDSREFPFTLMRDGTDQSSRMAVNSVSHQGGNAYRYSFSSPDFPQEGDSIVVKAGTPLLTDALGNPSNMKSLVKVTGVPFPVFIIKDSTLPRVASYGMLQNAPVLASSILVEDAARPGLCLNCADPRVRSAFEANLAAPRNPAFQPHLLSLMVQGPVRYDIAFYGHMGSYINRAAGMVDEGILAAAAKDQEGRYHLRLHWWPVAGMGGQVRTGAYIARGVLSANDLIQPDPDAPGANRKLPKKSEKVSILFGYLQRR